MHKDAHIPAHGNTLAISHRLVPRKPEQWLYSL